MITVISVFSKEYAVFFHIVPIQVCEEPWNTMDLYDSCLILHCSEHEYHLQIVKSVVLTFLMMVVKKRRRSNLAAYLLWTAETFVDLLNHLMSWKTCLQPLACFSNVLLEDDQSLSDKLCLVWDLVGHSVGLSQASYIIFLLEASIWINYMLMLDSSINQRPKIHISLFVTVDVEFVYWLCRCF